MKWVIVVLVSFMISMSSVCFAIDLDSEKLIDNIIKSLDEERDNWIIRGSRAYYITGHIDSEIRNKSWPEQDERCLVHLNYQIFHTHPDEGYVTIDKPVDMHLHGNDRIKMKRKLRQVMYEELHNRFNTRLPKKKIEIKVQVKKEVEKSEVDSDGLKKL